MVRCVVICIPCCVNTDRIDFFRDQSGFHKSQFRSAVGIAGFLQHAQSGDLPGFHSHRGVWKGCTTSANEVVSGSIGALSIWLIIISRGSLYTASILAVSNFIVSAAWLQINFRGLIRQISKRQETTGLPQVSWREEILPMQWRIALSWMSGYFIYQLINPLLFKYQSSAVAGQMGMSQSISNIALGISIAWISTKFPTY